MATDYSSQTKGWVTRPTYSAQQAQLFYDTSTPVAGPVTLSPDTPAGLGLTAFAGTSIYASRSDHVHPAPAFSELRGNPSTPATDQLIGITSGGALQYIEEIDGGTP
jgi:hypothetical protein